MLGAGEPSAAAGDAQSVKTSGNVAEAGQGIGAGKKIKGESATRSPTPLDWS